MPLIPTTSSQNSTLYFVREIEPGVTPDNPDWYNLGITNTSLGIDPTLITSEKFNDSRIAESATKVSATAGGTITQELEYGGDTDLLLSSLFCNEWENDSLDLGRADIFMTFLARSYNTLYGRHLRTFKGSRIASSSITLAKSAYITIENTISSIEMVNRYADYIYQDATAPSIIVGNSKAIWINTADGKVYDSNSQSEWNTTEIGTLVSGATWLSGAVDPTTEGVDDDFYLNTDSGEIFKKVGGSWVSQFIFKPSTWTASAVDPTTGTARELHLNTDTGDVFQYNDSTWDKIANFKLSDVTRYYTGNTIQSEISRDPMVWSKAGKLEVNELIDPICIDSMTINIDNTVTSDVAMCSNDTGLVGNKSNVNNKDRIVATVDMNVLFASQEIYDYFVDDKTISGSVIFTDGTAGYKFTFHKLQFATAPKDDDGGLINLPISFSILEDESTGKALTITRNADWTQL